MRRPLQILLAVELVLLVALAVFSATAGLLEAAQDPGAQVLHQLSYGCALLLMIDLILIVTLQGLHAVWRSGESSSDDAPQG